MQTVHTDKKTTRPHFPMDSAHKRKKCPVNIIQEF